MLKVSCGSAVQEVLDFNLVVHSPYQKLTANLKDAQAAELAECAWCFFASTTSPFHKGIYGALIGMPMPNTCSVYLQGCPQRLIPHRHLCDVLPSAHSCGLHACGECPRAAQSAAMAVDPAMRPGPGETAMQYCWE